MDCGEIKKANPSAKSGVYSILINSTELRMDVYCDMDMTGGGWTVSQHLISQLFGCGTVIYRL